MTGQYSIRNGLSLIAIEGTQYTLPARAFTMGELFKSVNISKSARAQHHAIPIARGSLVGRVRLWPKADIISSGTLI
jgi:arylsulfatase A-like enzyme